MKKIMKSGSKKLSKAQKGKEVKETVATKEANNNKTLFDIQKMTDRLNRPNTVSNISATTGIFKASQNNDVKKPITVKRKGGSIKSKRK
jgi:hypothetical protein